MAGKGIKNPKTLERGVAHGFGIAVSCGYDPDDDSGAVECTGLQAGPSLSVALNGGWMHLHHRDGGVVSMG
jgi:hypothetical protein